MLVEILHMSPNFLAMLSFVATFLALPLRSGLGSCRRLRRAAVARPFFPRACALDWGKHFGLPSLLLPLAHAPRILPSGPNLTHFC